MNEGVNYLQTFNPLVSNPELLERTLVGRKEITKNLEESVIESATTGNKLQRLIIGNRGSGKTHVLRVLQYRLFNNIALKDKLEIAYLVEDEYGVATFLDWIIRILKAFIRWCPEKANYLSEEIDKLKKVPVDDRERIAITILMNYIQERTVLIIVENIGVIFDENKGFGKKGQKKFRDLVQQNPQFTIMASNQALFPGILKEDMPFHNFFNITHLEKLSFEKSLTLLRTIAECDDKRDLLEFIDSADGRGRIKAIYDLVGGNHRLLVTFYQFLKTDFINRLSDTFLKTMNDLTPYFQNLMSILTSQQQKIIQYLCEVRIPVNVKTISENCFSKENIISKQMSNLLRLKYVSAIPSGRETFYELSEPLLRIHNEVKENRGGPIKLFIDFLGNLYSAQQIRQKYKQCLILSKIDKGPAFSDYLQEQIYLKETMKKYFPEKFTASNIEEFEKISEDFQIKTYIEELETSKAYSELLEFTSKVKKKERYLLLKEAKAHGKIGDTEKAIEKAKLLLKKNEKDIDVLFILAEAFQKKEDFATSDNYFNKILSINENNINALNGLGFNLIFKNKYKEAEQVLKKILLIEPKNNDALKKLGIALGDQGDYKQAHDYFKKLTELMPEDSEGWCLLGKTQINLNRKEEAKASYLKAIKLDDNNLMAIGVLGVLFGLQADYKQAYNFFKKFTELEPELSEGWCLLGKTQINLKRIEEAKVSYFKAIELNDKNSEAILLLGVLFSYQGDYKQAYNYFKKITELKPDYSEGWSLLGQVQFNTAEIKEAKVNCLKAIKLDEKNSIALKVLGGIFGVQGDYKQAYNFFKKVTELEPELSEGWRLLGKAQNNLNKIEEAKASYLKALKFDERNASAIQSLGVLFLKQGNHNQALNYIDKALAIIPDNDQLLNSKGEILRKSNQFEKAIKCYEQTIKINPSGYYPYFNLVTCQIGLNHTKEALRQFEKTLKISIEQKITDEIIDGFQENFTTLFNHASHENIVPYFNEALSLIEKYGYVEQFYKSIPVAIFELLKQHDKIETDHFEFIKDFLNQKFINNKEMIVPLKFFNIGIKHLKKKEKNALLQFTKEERATFHKFVLEKIK